MTKKLCFIFFALFLGTATVRAENWPGWRGPRGDGYSSEKGIPLRWSDTENVLWKTAIPGIGHSSPIVWGDRVFVTSCLLKEQLRVLVCLDRRDGKILWQREVVKSPLEPKHKLNSYASSTPATDGQHVYVTFMRCRPWTAEDMRLPIRDPVPFWKEWLPEMLIVCYDFEGNKIWEKVPGRFHSRHGFCTAPILYKDLVILNGDQDAYSYIVALDKKSGAEKWRTERPFRYRSYCAPLIAQAGGKTQMVLTGCKTVTSYDPDTGKLIWIIDGPTEQFVASPVYADGLFFLTAGFPDYHNMGIKPDGQGNITATHVVWHEKKTAARKAAYVPSPLAVDKFYYVISDQGPLSCFDTQTGKRHWMETLGRHHSASPVLLDGHLLLTDDDGITYVLPANGKFEVLARNDLKDECYSSPAISQGHIFLRTLRYLHCLGKK